MTIKQQRSILYVSSAVLAIASILVLLISIISIPQIQLVDHTKSDSRLPSASADLETEPRMDQLLRVANLPLRRPLVDPPAAAPPPLRLKLSGTIIEPGMNRAILISADGRSALHSVGDIVDQAEIVTIETDKISIRFRGELLTLKAETSKQ